MPDGALLEVRGLSRRFGGVQAVRDASFDVAEGAITALIGPNGAGKTTAFNLIGGFLRPDAGTVDFAGERIVGYRPDQVSQRLTSDQIARRGLVRTFQLTNVFGKMRVLDNVMLAAPAQPGERLGVALFRPRVRRRREAEVHEQALQMLSDVGLEQMAEEYAATLSGGQRKLLEIARALMSEPRMVMLDEPMAGVNPTLGRRLLAYLDRLRDSRGLTVLFVEHDMDVVMEVSQEVVVMADGAVIAQGTPDEVRTDARVIDAYLGAEVPAA
jgi:neutral amino acid transport system ATP-binding protein